MQGVKARQCVEVYLALPNKRLKLSGPAFRGDVRLCASVQIPQRGALAPASVRPAA